MRAIVLILAFIIPLQALGDDLRMSPSIQEVKKQNEARFFTLNGVVSVGIGLDPKGNQAIPASVEGYPVVIQIVGAMKAQ